MREREGVREGGRAREKDGQTGRSGSWLSLGRKGVSEALQPLRPAANGMKWLDDTGKKQKTKIKEDKKTKRNIIVAVILVRGRLWQIGNYSPSPCFSHY